MALVFIFTHIVAGVVLCLIYSHRPPDCGESFITKSNHFEFIKLDSRVLALARKKNFSDCK